MAYTRTDPGAGNPGAIIEAGYQRGSRAFEIRAMVLGALFRARTRIEGSAWQGHGAAAYQASLDAVMTQIAPLASQLEAESIALRKYGNQVEAIAEKAATLRHRIKAVDDELIALNLRAMVPPELRGEAPTDSVGDERIRAALAARRHDVASQKSALDAEWDVLFNDRIAADNECVAALTGGRVLGGISALPSGGLPDVDTAGLLALLARLSPAEITALFAVFPGPVETLAHAPADQVAAWWFGYSDQTEPPFKATPEQLALIQAIPTVIGNLDGVAYWARDRANRIVLEQAITDAPTIDTYNSLREIEVSLGDHGMVPPRQLISLTQVDQDRPLAAISVGDLDASLFTTFQVSGMNSSTADMGNAVEDARNLYKKQSSLSNRFASPSDLAVVAWIGYDSPDYVTVTQPNAARVGARALSDALLGYQATRQHTGAADPFVTVEAHSYGSTTAMLALSDKDLGVDALAMYGSAGATNGIDEASDLHVPDGQVWVGQNDDDFIATFGSNISLRSRPGTWADSLQFGTGGGFRGPLSGDEFAKSKGHGEYLVTGTESLRNLALIGLNRGDLIKRSFIY